MGDAGGAETDIAQEMRDAAFGYRSDPFSGELTGGPTAQGADRSGATVVAPELGGIEPQQEKPPEVVAPEVTPEKPAEEKPPIITRAKRRRSLLTEEEGGVLRKPTVYRRSLLGR